MPELFFILSPQSFLDNFSVLVAISVCLRKFSSSYPNKLGQQQWKSQMQIMTPCIYITEILLITF